VPHQRKLSRLVQKELGLKGTLLAGLGKLECNVAIKKIVMGEKNLDEATLADPLEHL